MAIKYKRGDCLSSHNHYLFLYIWIHIYLLFFQNNSSIATHYTLLYALFHQRLIPKCPLQATGHPRHPFLAVWEHRWLTVCPKMSWLMSHQRARKHRVPPSTFQSTVSLDPTRLIATTDEWFCSIANSLPWSTAPAPQFGSKKPGQTKLCICK